MTVIGQKQNRILHRNPSSLIPVSTVRLPKGGDEVKRETTDRELAKAVAFILRKGIDADWVSDSLNNFDTQPAQDSLNR